MNPATPRVLGVLTLISVEAILYGFSYPYFSLALYERNVSLWLVGLNASVAGVGILFLGPLLPSLISKLGIRHLVTVQFSISLLCFAVLLLSDNLILWFVSRLLMGACFASLWTTTEIWLNGVAPDAYRGRIIGASGTLYAASQFIGPLILGTTGVGGSPPILAAVVLLAAGSLVAFSIRPVAKKVEDDEHEGSWAALIAALPFAGPLLMAAAFAGIGETAMQSLLPIYGREHGLNTLGASALVAAFSLGEALLVIVLGLIADRFGRHLVMLLCTSLSALVCGIIPLVALHPQILWLVLFVSGGTISGLYTLGVILIGQDFNGQKLVVVSTGFAMAYSAGSVIGATPMGWAMQTFGPETLPLMISVIFIALFFGLRAWRKKADT